MNQAEFLELRWLLHRAINEGKRARYTMRVQSGCEGKHPFFSRADAERGMHSESTRKSCEPYRCPYCGKWHVGARRRA